MMKYGFLKSLRADVAYHRRFLSTAAVRDNPILTKKTGTKIPKSQRKAMVDDYVTKYRAINAGKFPCVENTRNQVGGSWYTVRAILSELKHYSKHKDSVVQPAAQRNDTSAIKETVDSVTPLHTIAEAEDYGDLSEYGVDDNGSYEKTVVMPIVTRTKDTSVKDDFGNHTMVNVVLRGDKTCDGADTRYWEARKVSNEQVLVEETSPDMTVMESATEDFNLSEKSELSFQRPGLSSKVCTEINKPSDKSPDFTIFRVPGPVNMKQQDDGSMLPDVEITNEASMVVRQRTEAYQISTEITDSQVITDRTSITDNVKEAAEIGSTNQGGVETGHSQMKLSNSIPKKVSGSDTIVSEFDRTSTLGVDNMENIGVGDNLNLVEKSSTVEVIKASETETSQFCANSSRPSDIAGGDDTRFGGDKNVSPTTSKTDGGYSRGTYTKEKQENFFEETVWGNLKSMASRFINSWRKT